MHMPSAVETEAEYWHMQMMLCVLANRGRFSAVGGLRKATARLVDSVQILVSGSSVDAAEAKAFNAWSACCWQYTCRRCRNGG